MGKAIAAVEGLTAKAGLTVWTRPNSPSPHQRSPATIDDVTITLEEVMTRLASLDVNSSMGPDCLHPCLLKHCPNLATPASVVDLQAVLTPG